MCAVEPCWLLVLLGLDWYIQFSQRKQKLPYQVSYVSGQYFLPALPWFHVMLVKDMHSNAPQGPGRLSRHSRQSIARTCPVLESKAKEQWRRVSHIAHQGTWSQLLPFCSVKAHRTLPACLKEPISKWVPLQSIDAQVSRKRLETAMQVLERQNVYDPDLLIYRTALNMVRSASLNCYIFNVSEACLILL